VLSVLVVVESLAMSLSCSPAKSLMSSNWSDSFLLEWTNGEGEADAMALDLGRALWRPLAELSPLGQMSLSVRTSSSVHTYREIYHIFPIYVLYKEYISSTMPAYKMEDGSEGIPLQDLLSLTVCKFWMLPGRMRNIADGS